MLGHITGGIKLQDTQIVSMRSLIHGSRSRWFYSGAVVGMSPALFARGFGAGGFAGKHQVRTWQGVWTARLWIWCRYLLGL